MKFLSLLILFMGSCAGFSPLRAQQLPAPSPFVLAVTKISSASVVVWTNATVSFHFQNAGAINVDQLDDELAKKGVNSQRIVRIMDGNKVIAEGRLRGRAWADDSNGFGLKFESLEAAKEAGRAIRKQGVPKMTKPKLKIADDNDRRSWIY